MKKTIRISVAIIICVATILGYYYYLSHRNENASVESNTEVSEVSIILDKDLDKDYPATPRAVIKFYNRIITAYYGEEYTNVQFEKLADQARMLLDEELLEYNPRDEYISSLAKEVTDYKNRGRYIVSSDVSDTNNVHYAVKKGRDVAYVTSYYFTKEASTYERVYQEYVLRKDSAGRWKILTFRLVNGDNYQ